MTKETKRVIVLKDVHPWAFEEVIFVLKNNAPQYNIQANLVNEAKKIVEDYASRTNYANPIQQNKKDYHSDKRQTNNLNGILNVSLIISIMIFVSLIIKAFN